MNLDFNFFVGNSVINGFSLSKLMYHRFSHCSRKPEYCIQGISASHDRSLDIDSAAIVTGNTIVPGHYCRVLLHFAQQSYLPCL